MELRKGYRLVITAFLLFGITVGIYECHESALAHSDSAHVVNLEQQVNNK